MSIKNTLAPTSFSKIITPQWIEKTKTSEYQTELAKALILAFGSSVVSRWNEINREGEKKKDSPPRPSLRLLVGGKK